MSLGIVIKGPEGLVLASESRVTLAAQSQEGPMIHVNFDNATKLFSVSSPNKYVGVVTYGLAAIGLRTANSFLPEFQAELPKDKRLSVKEFSEKLSKFFMKCWEKEMPKKYEGPPMTFVVGGFNEGEPYGRVFVIDIPTSPKPRENHSGLEDFGITWGGQREFVDRLIKGYDKNLPDFLTNQLKLTTEQKEALNNILGRFQMPMPIQAMSLQDCVDLAVFFIKTTIDAQNMTIGIRGCGGPIDVAIITREGGFDPIQRKKISAEKNIIN